MGEFFIHDNGGEPFRVVVNKNDRIVDIYDNYEKSRNPLFSIKNYKKIFIGMDDDYTRSNQLDYEEYAGNSILVEINVREYIYIGSEIYSFETEEDILDYYSPVGNSDVPYPYAIGQNNVYLMIEEVYFPVNLMKTTKKKKVDPYELYYDKKIDKKYINEFEVEVIQERL